jgi:predicted nucleotidyltransferase
VTAPADGILTPAFANTSTLASIANGNFRYICGMTDLNIIKQMLTLLKPELRDKYHVSSIGLFGSVVRDDFNPSSDIDIIVDFSQPIGIEFIDLADFIERKLKKNVDLVSKNGVKQKYYRTIESEIIYV